MRDYISSPGYDTSSSNAPTSSPDPCEYTYEGAIQDYKSRVLRASSNTFTAETTTTSCVVATTAVTATVGRMPKSPSSDIEYRLNAFENNAVAVNINNGDGGVDKKNLPKIDITKRREMFEKEAGVARKSFETNKTIGELSTKISIKDRVSSLENREEVKDAAVKKLNRLSGEFNRVKDRLSNIESPIVNSVAIEDKLSKIDVPVVSLKDRLFSLQSAAFEEKSRDPPKKIDLLGDQRLVPMDKVNGNQDNRRESEPIVMMNFDNVATTVQSSNGVSPPLQTFEELLIDDGDLQADAYQQLEVIQEEREEHQLHQQVQQSYIVPSPVAAKKPEVMPRTTRNITPDPQQKPAEYMANVSLDDHHMHDDIDSDLNDDIDLEDDSVSVTIALNNNNHTVNEVNHLAISRSDCSQTMVVVDTKVVNETETNINVDSHSQCSSTTVNVLTTQEIDSSLDQLTNISQNSNASNHDSGVDTADTIHKSINVFEQIHCQEEVRSCVVDQSVHDAAMGAQATATPVTAAKSTGTVTQSLTESFLSKNQRIKCQIVGVLEKNRKSFDAITAAPMVQSLLQSIAPPSSAPKSPKSPSKTKNIFDFIKRNLLNEATAGGVATDGHVESYQPIAVDPNDNKANSKSVNEIDRLLDEELDKLSEDERL